MTEVQTTYANVQEVELTQAMQEDLAQHDLLPDEQIVDTGYVDAELLVSSHQNDGITLLGPVLSDTSWQAKAGKGFDVGSFQLDGQAQPATVGVCSESGETWSLPQRSVLLAQCAASAPSRQPQGGYDRCAHQQLMKPCRHADTHKRQQHFGRRIRHGRVSRARTPSPCAGWA
jgi:hypothetical protein